MRTLVYCLLSASAGAGAITVTAHDALPGRSPETILESYVEDFRSDAAAAQARTFGVRVDGEAGGAWTVVVGGTKQEDGTYRVDLREGAPEDPTFIYTLDAQTLTAIDAGRINALTAAGKAFPDDETPLDCAWMPGAERFDNNAFGFHFWTRGFPEKVPFDRSMTRTVHGCGIVVFYYQPGFRSAWTSMAKGEGANNGPGQPLIAPFPTMVVATKGRTKGRVDGKPVEAKAGEMIFIPPMTPHEWWNDDEEPAEAVLLFFGEGA